MRHLVLPFAYIVISTSLAFGDSTQGCTLGSDKSRSAAEIANDWSPEAARYRLSTSKMKDGKRDVEYTADVLNISSSSTQTLIRRVERPRSDIKRLTLDARRIIIDGPLAFDSIDLTIRAETVIFAAHGMLRITDSANSRITLITKQLVLDSSLERPFVFTLATHSPEAPLLSVNAQGVRIDDGQDLSEAELIDLFYAYSLDSINPGGAVPRGFVNLKLGTSGLARYDESLTSEMEWPRFFASHVAAIHAEHPYDPRTKAELTRNITLYTPDLRKVVDIGPLASILRTQVLIDEDRDSLGWSREFAPRENMTAQMKDLGELTNQQSSSYVESLKRLIVEGDTAKKDDNGLALDLLRRQNAALQANIGAGEADLNDAITRNDEDEAAVGALLHKIGQRHASHEQDVKDKIERAKQAGSVKIVGTAVAVVAMIACQPEVAVPLATLSQAGGDMIYAHNTGGETSLMSLGQAVAAASEQTAKLKDASNGLKSSWAALGKSRDNLSAVQSGKVVTVKQGDKDVPLTESDAKKAVLENAVAIGQSIGKLFAQLKDQPTPIEISLTTEEAGDTTLTDELRQIDTLRLEQKQLLAKMAAVRDTLSLNQIDLLRSEEQIQALNNGNLDNDADKIRWSAIASSLWTAHFAAIDRKAAALERTYFVLTGMPLITNSQVEGIPKVELSNKELGTFDPLVDGSKLDIALDTYLSQEIDRENAWVNGLVEAAKAGKDEYLSKRFSGTVADYRASFNSDMPPGSNGKMFMDGLNELVALALKRTRDGKGGESPRIVIPYQWDTEGESLPEYFLKTEVVRLELEPKSEEIILRFRIEHPAYGFLYRNGSCVPVDFRLPGAMNTHESITTLPPFNPAQTMFSVGDVRKDVEGEDFYTFLPARAPYLVSISFVQPPPANIKKIAIKRVDFKTHYFK